MLDPNDPIVVSLVQGLKDLQDAVLYGTGTPNPANPFSELFDAKIKTLVQQSLPAGLVLSGSLSVKPGTSPAV